ncbi:MAG: tyrosine-protein phosphatase [Candidatus Nanopelagicales bacterium]|nr:tyrosine-protein phosphatase [Candidatus Nanopelagicales bacterium]
MTTSSAEPLHIDGLANIRDLGGLRTADGRVIRSRQVVRSDNPKSLTEQGHVDLLEVLSPRTVIDLRMDMEVERESYTLQGESTSVITLPMTPQSGVTQEQIDAGMADNLAEDYRRQIEANAPSIIGALNLVADPAARPVVIHCTAGKDRTGIVIALLLALLGVEYDAIVADYHVTAANMGPIYERIRAAQVFQDNGLASAPTWIFEAHPETMREFLQHLSDHYGGAEAYVLAKGMDPDTVQRLRAELLED